MTGDELLQISSTYTNAIWVVGFRPNLLRIYDVNNPAFF